jgi:hypothetical protein
VKVGFRRERDRMNQQVEPAPLRADAFEHRFEFARPATSSGMKISAPTRCASGSTYWRERSLR